MQDIKGGKTFPFRKHIHFLATEEGKSAPQMEYGSL